MNKEFESPHKSFLLMNDIHKSKQPWDANNATKMTKPMRSDKKYSPYKYISDV